MVMAKRTAALSIVLGLAALVGVRDVPAPGLRAQEASHPAGAQAPAEKRWRAVAPGRVEPVSGQIRIAASALGRIDEVLVKINDKVFAGEPLIRLDDEEARARLAAADAQVAFHKRQRDHQSASSRASDRRDAEDSVADAEKSLAEAQSAVDKVAAARRAGGGPDADLDKARAALSIAQNRLVQSRAELRRMEPDAPLPTQTEGELAVARAEHAVAAATMGRLTVRAPIASTVLQVNARRGELASPAQPLLVVGDISALRVRAEVDERDYAQIRIGQGVTVRADAFGAREFAGKVASIAPLVEPSSINARGLRTLTDVNVVEVMVDMAEPGLLAVGMKVDVYFSSDGP
jgi:HlyD family secretion protein